MFSRLATLAFLATVLPAAAETPAKQLFGAVEDPAPLAARSIGSYSRGCLAGAALLPVNGPTWQVMRLSRNRNWGNPVLVGFLEHLASKAPAVGWNGLLVGDLSQPRGGPMSSGHASHQIGLDADIWLTPMPKRELTYDERERVSAVSMLAPDKLTVDPKKFSQRQFNIIRLAAKQPEVERIFVNRAIKKALCEGAGSDRAWLSKVRPWWGHDFHFHVRMACPANSPTCKPQASPPSGDGCGAELQSWYAPPPKPTKPSKPKPPRPEITLKDLPPECSQVLVAK
ncbi:penicillin-insensitive murein endopeptidase [Pleomorphomonas sp. JP5]|uniref:penicillin-insensitive murein endopeptidase n=1 Tax=Pleomorphomonas sp. JP5 TaxID=2942998 RepID=UPI0020434A7C|nr:penicillin-insensitive murein endopeptidase [Pleomorphomonas sp. JP5]MCM5557994.1 penicillin-insensitive murein endopeptidase [Pleomorphomonas sp. JP5]